MKFKIQGTDAYTLAGDALISESGRKRSSYYMSNRYSPMKAWPDVAEDDRMVFWGLSKYIKRYLTKKVTPKHLLKIMKFMDQARIDGGPLKFNHKMWQRVIDNHNGYLPVVIEALPEGSVFYPHQPMVQVTSLDEGFGELAAFVEARMVGMVAKASARATLAGHFYDFIQRELNKYDCKLDYRNLVHDFGMRAHDDDIESENYGLAHLLFFNGTDTFDAAFKAFEHGADGGKSILALAHRIVQSYENEEDCYKNIVEQDDIVSCVADCYDFKHAVSEYLIPLAKKHREKIIVVRPDSGNTIENILFVCREAYKETLTKQGDKYIEPLNLRILEGNSVNPQVIKDVYKAMTDEGFSPEFLVWGIGGYFVNNVSRDSLSSAYKLNGVANSTGGWRPVMKFAEPGKESIPGPHAFYNGRISIRSGCDKVNTIPFHVGNDDNQRFVTYYHNGEIAKWVGNYKDVQKRCRHLWDIVPKNMPREKIVEHVQDNIDSLRKKYQTNV